MASKRRRKSGSSAADPFHEPHESARAAQLCYVSDDKPGIRRRAAGTGFAYFNREGELIEDETRLTRIKALGIPPAWTDVWICPLPHGHLQASGRDAKGRKQYRYHPRWRAIRDETKFERMALFGAALPRMRERVAGHLKAQGLPREKVLAIVVSLLESTFIRVGNEEYARANKSFGLTTMRERHVTVNGAKIRFRFRGKSGKEHQITLANRRLARLVSHLMDLPGQAIFQYLDEQGEPRPVDSGDVNDYLKEISGEEFSAKDFRTWAGTLLAARCLAETDAEAFASAAAAKSACVSAVASVAERLGNTATICRKCYIHPKVLQAFTDDALRASWMDHTRTDVMREGLLTEETALLGFLAVARN
jgi:DNA topoisomerase-1